MKLKNQNCEIVIDFNDFLLDIFEEAQKVADQTNMSQVVFIDGNDFAYSSNGYFMSLNVRPRKIAQIFPK